MAKIYLSFRSLGIGCKPPTISLGVTAWRKNTTLWSQLLATDFLYGMMGVIRQFPGTFRLWKRVHTKQNCIFTCLRSIDYRNLYLLRLVSHNLFWYFPSSCNDVSKRIQANICIIQTQFSDRFWLFMLSHETFCVVLAWSSFIDFVVYYEKLQRKRQILTYLFVHLGVLKLCYNLSNFVPACNDFQM